MVPCCDGPIISLCIKFFSDSGLARVIMGGRVTREVRHITTLFFLPFTAIDKSLGGSFVGWILLLDV